MPGFRPLLEQGIASSGEGETVVPSIFKHHMEASVNCWEFKKCGRERDGAKAGELGVCPASFSSGVSGWRPG